MLSSRTGKGVRKKLKKLKACPRGENRNNHKLCQIKSENAIRMVKKKDLEEILKYISKIR